MDAQPADLAEGKVAPRRAHLPDENSVLLAALDYAARGWPVFPCAAGGRNAKRPLVPGESSPGAKGGGLYLASTDPAQIRERWRRFPDAMIGVPTGPKTGFLIDLDLGAPPL